MKRKITLVGIVLTLLLTLLLTSCGAQTEIVYELNGGELSGAPTSFKKGNAPDLSDVIPTRSGYEFGGWYMDAKFKTEINIPSDAEGTITLYAKWVKKYSISYEMNGGTAAAELPTEYIAGEELDIQDYAPEKEGYIFFGWYLDESFSDKADIDEETEGNLTLYARWLDAPSFTAEIPDKNKPFLGDGSSFSIDLSQYSQDSGFTVLFSAESSDTSVATVSVDGDTLTVELLKGTGSADITVSIHSDEGVLYDTDTFKAASFTVSNIACVGDSITRAAALEDGDSYPEILNDLLGANYTTFNFGESGAAVTPYGKYQKAYKEYEGYANSLESNADIIVIMLGTNDSKGWEYSPLDFSISEFKKIYTDLIDSYKKAFPDAVIYLVSVIPVRSDNTLSFDEACISKIFDAQMELAEELELPILDFYEIIDETNPFENGYYLSDGIHLTRKGTELLAQSVLQFLLNN